MSYCPSMIPMRNLAFRLPVLLLLIPHAGCGESYMPSEGSLPATSTAGGRLSEPYRLDGHQAARWRAEALAERWVSAASQCPQPRNHSRPRAGGRDSQAVWQERPRSDQGLDPIEERCWPSTRGQFRNAAEPRVAPPSWEEVVRLAVVRPDPSKGVAENFAAFATALQGWKPEAAKKDWTTASAVKSELQLDDATLARGSVLYRRWCLQCHGPNGARRWCTGHSARGHAARLPPGPLQVRDRVRSSSSAGPEPEEEGAGRRAASRFATT